MRRIRSFLTLTPVEKLAAVAKLYHRAKTECMRSSFGRMGHGCLIRRPITLRGTRFMSLGDRVSIRDGARLEVCITRSGRRPCLTIGSDTSIEQNIHLVCHNRIAIGRNVMIAANCAIVDTSHTFAGRAPGEKADRLADDDAEVEICDGAFLGVGVVVLPGVRIGVNAVVGANSVVTRDVPDGYTAAGIPARMRYTAADKPACGDAISSEGSAPRPQEHPRPGPA